MLLQEATPSPVDCHDLSSAIKKGDLEGVRRILSQNVDINCRVTNMRVTPVLEAAYWGRREVLEFLVSEGAYALLPNSVDYTILHMASSSGDVETVKYVLSLNIVDIDARTKFRKTAVSVAKVNKHWQVVRLLKSHGAH
ncbi:ankyrin repeat-containing protein DDB_G0279043-like [Haliotis rufescens]|uniref:ankyrin repeat-containing protein DDB_G0279043-like n=1 Tax=Haliotis rufescens TaxID=6454 RepID=UPI00201EE2CD|nr:ankyrin repeat-containing protein DDB_G0279043-like [Haliotis rufescens]